MCFQPAAARHFIPYVRFTLSLFLLLSYAIFMLFASATLSYAPGLLRSLSLNMSLTYIICCFCLGLGLDPLLFSRMAPELLPLSFFCLSDFFSPD